MKTIIYVGPFDSVEVEPAKGRVPTIFFKRSEPVEVTEEVARSLLAQTRNFREPTIKTGEKK